MKTLNVKPFEIKSKGKTIKVTADMNQKDIEVLIKEFPQYSGCFVEEKKPEEVVAAVLDSARTDKTDKVSETKPKKRK